MPARKAVTISASVSGVGSATIKVSFFAASDCKAEVNRLDQVLPRQERAAVVAEPERQRPRRARDVEQPRQIALHAVPIDEHRPKDGVRHLPAARTASSAASLERP